MGSTLGTLRKLVAVGRAADNGFDRRLVTLAAFSLTAAIAELATLGSLVPLLASLANGRVPDPPVVGRFLPDSALGLVVVFACLVLVTALVRLALTATIQRGVLHVGHAINVSIQRRLLDQPYLFHATANSSRFVTALHTSDELALGLLRPLIQGFAGLLIGAAILAFLVIAIGWSITLGAAAVLGGAYFLMSRFAGLRLVERGGAALVAYEEQVRLMMESSGAIRDILLDHRQPLFAEAFESASARMAEARSGTDLLGQAPRFLVEALGATALAALAAVIAARDGGIAGSLASFGLLALAMVRIVPLAQMAYSGWTRLASNRRAVDDVAGLLSLPLATDTQSGVEPLALRNAVAAEGLQFAYPDAAAPVLDGASFTVTAGEWVGLTGPTGAGKSTLADLIMGLLTPDTGRITIDGEALTPALLRRWQRALGHVSQSAYLLDDSIVANIALTPQVTEEDHSLIAECARIAQLDPVIAGLPAGLNSIVGESGRRLSGGQRQRIAIARALYKRPALLVLDEATGALDGATEAALFDALSAARPGLTVIIISHRSTTLARCKRVVRVEGGRVTPA